MPASLSGPVVDIVACPPQTVPVLTNVKTSQAGNGVTGIVATGGIAVTSGKLNTQDAFKETRGLGVIVKSRPEGSSQMGETSPGSLGR
jgi:hypothetical protein